MTLRNKHLTIPGHENESCLASLKSTYLNVFFHGDNLEDSLSAAAHDPTVQNDNFARKNFLVRLPRVVRVLYTLASGSEDTAWTDHYKPLFQSLADALAASETVPGGICVSWARYSGPPLSSVLSQRWLNDAAPDFAGTFPIADLVVGEVFTYVFVRFNFPYGNDFFSYTIQDGAWARYRDNYLTFTARHPRFEKFGGRIYQGEVVNDTDEIVERAVSGTAPMDQFGPGLSQYGWAFTRGDWNLPSGYIPLATILAEVKAFFGLA